MRTVIQILETCNSGSVARMVLDCLLHQEGAIGGRILEPSPSKPGWRVQVFIPDTTPTGHEPLPDGWRRVCLPPELEKELRRHEELYKLPPI